MGVTPIVVKQKEFSTLASKPKLEKLLVHYTLLSRKGPEELLLLIFVSLGKALDLPLSVVECRSDMVLKFLDNGRSILLDFHKKCQPLSTEDVINLVNDAGSTAISGLCDARIWPLVTSPLLTLSHCCLSRTPW